MGSIFLGTLTALMTLAAQGELGESAFSPGSARQIEIVVSPDGNDAEQYDSDPRPDYTKYGPFATVQGAIEFVRKLRKENAIEIPINILLKDGVYPITEPIMLETQDSCPIYAPISIHNYKDDTPIISGGRSITKIQQVGALWIAELPEVASGKWDFTSLWVNGERRQPARTPNAAHPFGDNPPDSDFFFADGAVTVKGADGKETPSNTVMRYRGEDLSQFPNLDNARVVVFHSWETSIHRVASINKEEHTATFTGPAVWPFCQWRQDQPYFVENVFEGLDQPGEWYLDKKSGKLYYMPMPGERIGETFVTAPVAKQLLIIKGDPANGKFVENINFRGLHFMYTDFPIGEKGHSDPQAAFSVNAAVEVSGARNISFTDCKIMHTGNHGLWLHAGTQNCTVEQCEITDLGAGGIRIGEGSSPVDANHAADHNTIYNNFIHNGGLQFRGGVGVWIGRASYNQVTHNEISDFRYTGVSVGWSWGYAESSANHNNIDYNHIHHIGLGQLNDMGGIYTLGISPGTTLTGNVIHDVWSHPKLYGGWGLYTDEGSTGILLNDNLVYNTTTGGFHQHYGENNIVRNNIFAYSKGHQVMRSREEDHNSFTFENNIVFFNNGQLLGSTWKNDNFIMDKNVYWDTSGMKYDFAGSTLEEWQAKGHDKNSIIADPLFEDAEHGDFTLKKDSPAIAMGFQPFTAIQAGLLGDEDWVAKPNRIKREPFAPPVPPTPVAINDDFEETTVGSAPTNGALSSGTNDIAKIIVSDESAASGKHSLKFIDAAGLARGFDPHLIYQPEYRNGTARASFALRIDTDTEIYHEWRDNRSPYRVGPNLWILPGGVLRASGKELLTLPAATWLNFEITCPLGNTANGVYDLSIIWKGANAQTFAALPCGSADFYRLDWFGFVSQKDGPQTWWLDDVKVGVSS